MKKEVNVEILTEDVNKLLKGKIGYFSNEDSKTDFQEIKNKKLKDVLSWTNIFKSNEGKIYELKATKNKDKITINLTEAKNAKN